MRKAGLVPKAKRAEVPPVWLIAAYRPVSLFSLRMTHATSKGGKTLVTPTPYVLKMSLLDACFRRFPAAEADSAAREVFGWIKDRAIHFRPPKNCVVNNTFVKVLDWSREPTDGPFKSTIAYREFAFFSGDDLLVALDTGGLSADERATLADLLAHLSQLGKRGCFWQFCGIETLHGALPFGFTVPRLEASYQQIERYEMTQASDDFGEALSAGADGFDRVSTYGGGDVRLGTQRVLTSTAVPYKRRSASRHYTWYERVQETDS
jgi:hypothetical protein